LTNIATVNAQQGTVITAKDGKSLKAKFTAPATKTAPVSRRIRVGFLMI
jgi:hypothetical protein